MKKSVLFFFIFSIISVSQVNLAKADEDVLQDVLNHLKDIHVQTGDLLIWATNKIDSVLIQKLTDGAYSHAGVLSVESGGKIAIYDVFPGQGLRKSYIEEHFASDRDNLIAMSVIHYKGALNAEEVQKRLDLFWIKKGQIEFDHAMELENGMDYLALLKGKKLFLYCTEFVFRLYEGIYSGPKLFENDYPRLSMKKDVFQSVEWTDELREQFQRWQGVLPVEQFQQWLASHKSQIVITANGMLRGGGFEILYETHNKERLEPWALKLLEASGSDTPVISNS